ncbi:filamentous haemagglutinin family protein [Peristeroidobacter soli]|uniref:filamentous haemagglutinin family protein n=1 Tax=Peristeroidobacter soli TaxID=2497877 RepID=UPI00101BCE29|nr:filamentous haemagglutinin family protein [Peristeroidobacter soli]
MDRKPAHSRFRKSAARKPLRLSAKRTSAIAIAVAAALTGSHAFAQTAPFGSMVAMQNGMVRLPNGTMSKWTGANRPVVGTATDGRPLMTIEQTEQKALLDWERFELQANEILEFQQQRADWIAVNRVHSDSPSRIDGEIRAIGRVFILNDNGVLMGEGATVNTRQLVTGRGVSDVLVEGNTTTLVQSKDKAILNWSDMSTQAGEVLKFQQEKKDWIALNRSLLEGQATQLKGDIKADGHLVLVAREGLAIDGKIEAQQVIASSLEVRDAQFLSSHGLMSQADNYNDRFDPTFSNTWKYNIDPQWNQGLLYADDPPPPAHDPNDPLRYAVTIGSTGSIQTSSRGKVMLFGPNVNNRGRIRVQDEGQVILGAGDNIYLVSSGSGGVVSAYAGAYNPMSFMRANIPYNGTPWRGGGVVTAEWVDFINNMTAGTDLGTFAVGDVMTPEQGGAVFNRIAAYINEQQARRVADVGFHARNEGIITSLRGGHVDFRGWNLEQMGSIEMTSTAAFRGAISFTPVMYDYQEYPNNSENGPLVPGNGNVVFGRGSLTQITPDLDATDTIPVSEGPQSVGSLTINARSVHLQQDAVIYLPSGSMNVLLDAAGHVFSNRGAGANPDNEDGTRFLMDRGATIDLSGWETTLGMGYHQVTGKLYAAQLADSPLQRDGALYRQEISVDRRFGTNVADWRSFDNLSQGTLAQFLINGGSLTMDIGDDFIMKAGSVIDVSGGKITYQDGFVYTSLLRRLDGSIIDIREADPDELYMGLANTWTKYDTKWNTQRTYYIPLMSSVEGRYETSYEQGGNAGSIKILAPDTVLQGTLLGGTTIGRYQRTNRPNAGVFELNNAGESEKEYVSNNILITAAEQALADGFGMRDMLSDVYGDLFGDEFDPETDAPASKGRLLDNTTLTSADFFRRSTMGSYSFDQDGRIDPDTLVNNSFVPLDGAAVRVEQGAQLNLANGASLEITAGQRIEFLGSVRTEGGDVSLTGMSLRFGESSAIDTRGSWYSDYELNDPVALSSVPRIDGGNISLAAYGDETDPDDVTLTLPSTMLLDATGGAWVDRNGTLKAGKGGDINVNVGDVPEFDLSGLDSARAYGLGGNGKFSMGVARNIHIGTELPAVEEDETEAMLFRPEFFQNSGFSAISLQSSNGTVTLQEGVHVNATSASLQLDPSTLHNGVLSAYYAPSGTDIYDLATPRYLPPEQRAAGLRNGMAISLGGVALGIGEGSLLSTEAGGSLVLGAGLVDVYGTLLAPAGTISLSGGVDKGSVLVHETARLLAPGAVRILSRGMDSSGRELVDGEVLNGGTINLSAPTLKIERGAVIDVSGTSAMFDLAQSASGSVVRQPRTVASDGGSISVSGQSLDVNDATFLGHAGGAGARGGNFSLSWAGGYELTRDPPWAPTPETVYDAFGWYFEYGYINDVNGNPLSSFFGTDLSQVDWNIFGQVYDFQFPPGFTVGSREELVALLKAYDAAVLGAAPVLLVGDNLPDTGSGGGGPLAPKVEPALRALLEQLGGYQFLPIPDGRPSPVTRLSPSNIVAGGFSGLEIDASPGIVFAGNATLGGRRADGSAIFDRIKLSAPRIMGQDGASVNINADVVILSGEASGLPVDQAMYDVALSEIGVNPVNEDTHLRIAADKLLQIESAQFYGYSDTLLSSGGDIRLVGGPPPAAGQPPQGIIQSAGKLIFKADQLYAATGRRFDIKSDDTIEILPQDAGTPINASPYEAGAELTLTAPRIVQGGTIRSPLGTINLVGVEDGSEGANTITLLPGSLTSVSGDGKVIPYGVTASGDTWIDPITGQELTALPSKSVNLTAETLDMREGAVLDVKGGGDLFASEFTPGIGGTKDWTTGYRNEDYEWVNDASNVFAVIPGYDAEIAPVGLGNTSGAAIGERIWLSGGSGLPAGYYTLLPARYALLPGAFRVTSNHHYGDHGNMVPGQSRALLDGSSIQAGYRFMPGADGSPRYTAQRTDGFLVMPGATLRERSQYVETRANTFYLSDAFLKKALRTNRPVGEVPRIPLDGGSVVLDASGSITLDATLRSAAAEGGRGGFADIKGEKILVAGAGTDLSLYQDYLVLDSDRLNGFGAESLLLGGVRQQGAVNVEIDVGATDIVIDNAGSVLSGPELLFASGGDITVKAGSAVETRGTISGSSGDLRVRPSIASYTDDRGTAWAGDDVLVHGDLDQGAVLRLSSSEQVDILRNINSVDALAQLIADPVALAAINAQRAAGGLDPITHRGSLLIEEGARLTSSRSLALDATNDTRLSSGASVSTRQISASASRVSVGEVPSGTNGLVFAGGSLGALAAAEDILLKSYSSIDFYGSATLRADGALSLDSRQINAVNADHGTVTIAGKSLTLTNTNGGTATATAGTTRLLLEGDNIYLAGEDKWLSGVGSVDIQARERVIGRDDNTLYVPAGLNIQAADVTADSGARLFFDAQGEVTINNNGNTNLPAFQTLGATLGVTGSSVVNQGRMGLTGGTINLRARSGNVTLAQGSSIDVTSNTSQIFDVEVGVAGGTVNLTSDHGNIDMRSGATIDISGTSAGGDAGTLHTSAAEGEVLLAGNVLGTANAGYRSGSFTSLSRTIADFTGLNAQLDLGGFRQSRRFEVNEGDINVSSTVSVQEFAAVANRGSINVDGTISTVGDNGGRIQLSAARNVTVSSTGRLIARANAGESSGGTVFLETTGENGGRINITAGSQIDVTGTGEGGRVVRLRAPQLGGDVAIDPVAGTILGARSVIAEAFRVYDNVHTIDQAVIDTVSADAISFMTNAAAIQARLGSGVTVAPGIELRSDSDMELVQDWDLHDLRFGTDQSAGVLTLRAAGDLLINGNLSDGFDGSTSDAALLGGNSWTLNLTAGANITSPDSLAVLPVGLLADGKGSIIVGGTPDTIEYYKIHITTGPLAGTIEHRLYLKDGNGQLVRINDDAPPGRYVELTRDAATGLYIDPTTNQPIQKDPVTGDYVETNNYGKVALPELYSESNGADQFLNGEAPQITQYGQSRAVQWDNSTGYMVRTGTAGINLASGRDIVLQYAPSVIYTAGQSAAPIADFHAPTRLPLFAPGDWWGPMSGYYLEGGGDLLMRAQGNIIGASSDQLPNAWLWRYGTLDQATGDFRQLGNQSLGRDYEQTTWFVRFDKYQAGIGALGGGNVDISAGGDVNNLTVNLPNTGRVSGGYNGIERVLHTSGGGDLSVRAGGNIGSGIFYVAEGTARLTAGGSFNSSRQVKAVRQVGFEPLTIRGYDLYTTLLTSSADFHLQSGGDLNIDAVLDPMNIEQAQNNKNGGGGNFGPDNIQQYVGDDRLRELYGVAFMSYTPDASVDLFSAGGDVNIWNNHGNLGLLQWRGSYMQPQHYFIRAGSPGVSIGGEVSTLWPATLSAVAAAGDVVVKGGMYLAPAPKGNLSLLAKQNVLFGQGSRIDDPFAELNRDAQNYFPSYEDIFMSQSRMDALPDATNIRQTYGSIIDPGVFTQAGLTETGFNLGSQGWDELHLPDLHAGDTVPARIYAAEGDVVTTRQINLPKQLWVQAGRHVYFPYYAIQHNSEQDLSLIRAGEGLYFSGSGYVNVAGPGRLEIETGKDFWMPSNAKGVTSSRIAYTDLNPYDLIPGAPWHPDQAAADIAISTGFNQTPNYEAFEDAYLNPELVAEMAEYLLDDAGGGRELPIYLFDRIYARGNGSDSMFASPELAAGFVNYVRGMQGLPPLATAADQSAYLDQAWNYWLALPPSQTTAYDGLVPRMTPAEAKARGAKPEFYQPERREGLVNYVRRLQGLEALQTQEEQLAYLDQAWTYWNTLSTDYKTPLYRNTFFMELRTTGREVNDPDSDRHNTTFRGYDAIATLFPGAQKRDGEALSEGESRWAGDFETFASRVISNGGGKVEYVIPGGGFKLANVSATPGETGQPTSSIDRGNALRAGVITQDGGDINIFSKSSVTVNNSRILTTKGGNIMIWSSYGDIAAGKGAKTSITPQFYDYSLGNWLHMDRVPAGLPTGAGIGTLATQPGVPVADVDLIAPNGIVDAGDAGLRVSGNFNVFAVQILGTDNIDVQGVSTGLPVPPAAPPTSLNIDDAAAKATKVTGALLDSLKKVQDNAAIKSPSIIEVKVLGYGEECAEDRQDCRTDEKSEQK